MANRGRGLHAYLVETEWVNDSSGSTGGRAMSYIALSSVVFAPLAIYFFVLGAIVGWGELKCANEVGGLWWRNAGEIVAESPDQIARLEECKTQVLTKTADGEEGDTEAYAGWLRQYLSFISTQMGLGILIPVFVLFSGIGAGWLAWRRRP